MLNVLLLAISDNDRLNFEKNFSRNFSQEINYVSLNDKIDVIITGAIYVSSSEFIEKLNSLDLLDGKLFLTLASNVEEKLYSESIGFSSLLKYEFNDENFKEWLSIQKDNNDENKRSIIDKFLFFLKKKNSYKSNPAIFLYLVLDCSCANLALAQHNLKSFE